MYLEKVTLCNFRNFSQEEVTFSKNLNCIEGENAEGKSNLLEAIFLLSTGKSFRTRQLLELIRYQQNAFQIQAEFFKEGISHTLSISYGPLGRKLLYNQTTYSSFLPLLGILPCILLTPEDISIVNGGPSERRKFIDLHLSQMDPLYVHHLGRYHKAMKQKNTLLKSGTELGIEPWELIMAESATYILQKRVQLISNLENLISENIHRLSEKNEQFSWNYENTLKTSAPDQIIEVWKKNRAKEKLHASTLHGPHRDELHFFIEKQEVKTYCSEGQKRSCIAAIRLAQWQSLKKILGSPPLFGIDDFGVHLDEKRSIALKNLLLDLSQVFLTAPSFDSPSELYRVLVTNNKILNPNKV